MNYSLDFTLTNKKVLNLETRENVFVPTATTNFLIDAVIQNEFSNTKKKILDLGCGTGVVGIALHQSNLIEKNYASDLGENAVKVTKANCTKYKIPNDIRLGSIYDPWLNEEFDIIVDDISGISDEIAKLSPWFSGVSCASGVDGANLTIKVIENSKKFLAKNGALYFPIISLSNEDRILEAANYHFTNIELVSNNEWPMPKELIAHIDKLNFLKARRHINYIEKFGLKLCYTKIFKIWG